MKFVLSGKIRGVDGETNPNATLAERTARPCG